MKKQPTQFDFWYAVNSTEILTMPTRHLEAFGTTMLNYYLISELMDTTNQVRVREGRIMAYRPQIIAPSMLDNAILDNFGEEAEKYANWLRDHEPNLHMLLYEFKIRKEHFSEQILMDNVKAVTEKVNSTVKEKADPFSAIVRGVDDPWDVCLLKLMAEVIGRSIPVHIKKMKQRNLFGETDGTPNILRQEIEDAFLAASKDKSLSAALATKLQKAGLWEKYQDRFFSLVRTND